MTVPYRPLPGSLVVALSLALLAVASASCGKTEKGAQADKAESGGAGGAGGAAGSGGAGPALVAADAKGPDGVTFKRVDLAFGSLELPDGKDWKLQQGSPSQMEGADGTVIMLQSQDGIAADQRDDYAASYHDVQMQAAPRYERVKQDNGEILGVPATRVEGKFDNGTPFVTRDYLVFSKGKVVALGGRTPATNAARLAPLMDHIAATLAVK
jgi:hypothetical protein